MEPNLLALGSSLHVPDIHALAASLDGKSDIPERYFRPEAEADHPVADIDAKLPIIDFGLAQISEEECAKIGRACEEWGIFQLINHGVPTHLMEKTKFDIAEFFRLPSEKKQASAFLPNSIEGYGQHFIKSEEQKLDWADMMTLVTFPKSSRNIRIWPTEPPTLRDTLDTYATTVRELASYLLRTMGKNLGLDPDRFMRINKLNELNQVVKMNHYPPCPKPKKVIGLSRHSDPGILTILIQSSDVQGLQVMKNGTWFPIKPIPGAFIVNVGDTLEILSNGKYKSIEHRAAVNAEKERLSIATFYSPQSDLIVGPLPELVNGGLENYKTMRFGEYMKAYFASKRIGKSQLEQMKLTKIC